MQQQGFLFTSSHKLGELGNKSKVEASKCMTFQVSDRRMGHWHAASTLHPRQPVQGIHAAASSTLHRVVTRSKYHRCSKYHRARLEGWTIGHRGLCITIPVVGLKIKSKRLLPPLRLLLPRFQLLLILLLLPVLLLLLRLLWP